MEYKKILKYLFAGSISTGTNLALLFLFVNYFKLWYLIGAIIGFCGGVITSYLLQKFFVFDNFSKENIQKQFSHFFIFALIMLGLNTLLMYFFVDIIGFWYLLSQILAALIIAFINYTYFNKVIFNGKNN